MIAYDCKWSNQTTYNVEDLKQVVALALELLQSRADEAGGLPPVVHLIQKVVIVKHDVTARKVALALKRSPLASAEYRGIKDSKTKAVSGQTLTISLADPQDIAGSPAEKMMVLATQKATQHFVIALLQAIVTAHPAYMTFVRGLLYKDFRLAEGQELPEGWQYGCRVGPVLLEALTRGVSDSFVLEKRPEVRFVYDSHFVLPEEVQLWWGGM